ncbi:MAG: DNA N-6-adenine-methyltransferase [Candidatus Helarchaeota archaeon]
MTAGRNINTKSQDWGTPEKYVKAVKEVFGGKINLDPCSSKYSIVNAEVEYMPPEHDGLKESWDFKTIYVNPPYGINKRNGTSIKHWLSRCAEAYEQYKSEVIALIPVAPNTGHWKSSIFGRATAICFLYDTRLRFLENGQNGGKGAPMACAMVYWGDNYQKFFDVFINHGAVVDIRPLKGLTIGPERINPQKSLFG